MSESTDVGIEQSRREPLPGTVKLYQRHLFVCTGQQDWPAKIEAGGGFLQALSEALTVRVSEMSLRVKVTACDEPSKGPGYDLLVFPEAVRYLGVQASDLPALIQDHLIGNRVSECMAHEPLTGQHIFVCTHGARDPQCGECGPPLIEHFSAALDDVGLANTVSLRGTSHVGGHRFAGNVLVYPGGDWYGYVTPDWVPRIIEQHIVNGQVVKDLWRGRMGLTPDEQLRQVDNWYGS
jgi:hypothetical protein